MNICKERINNRTKSLRERFSHNRSYSELSFKNVPSSSSTEPKTSTSPLPSCSRNIFHYNSNNKKSDFHFENESYCSALDLSGSQPIELIGNSGQFSWQKDAAVQCNILTDSQPLCFSSKKNKENKFSSALANVATVTFRNRSLNRWKENCPPILKRAASFNINASNRGNYARLVQSISSPSSPELIIDEPKITGPNNNIDKIDDRYGSNHNRAHPAVLLLSNAAMAAVAPFVGKSTKRSLPLITPLNETSKTNMQNMTNEKKYLGKQQTSSSAPESFEEPIDNNLLVSSIKTSSTSTESKNKVNNSENDDEHQQISLGDNELYDFDTKNRLLNISLQVTTEKEHKNSLKPFLLDLPNVPGNGCNASNSLNVNNSSYVNLPSPNIQSEIQGVNPVLRKLSVLSRSSQKGLKPNSTGTHYDDYIDLDDENEDDEEEDETGPDEQQLKRRSRRRALIPPKLFADDNFDSKESEQLQRKKLVEFSQNEENKDKVFEQKGTNMENKSPNDNDRITQRPNIDSDYGIKKSQEKDQLSPNNSLLGANLNSPSKNRRRSSVVVIPPMQICPGDLLVYSKVLTQRANLIEGSLTSSLLNEQDYRKSHKNTWSLLRLFDRSGSRSKTEQILCGLEEFLSNLSPSNAFVDDVLYGYRGVSWNEFVADIERRTNRSNDVSVASSIASNISRFINGPRFNSLQSTTLDSLSMNCPSCRKVNRSSHVYHSGPDPLIHKAASYSLERIRQDTESNPNNKFEVQSIKMIQRTDSVNTESEVDSIMENEVAPINPATFVGNEAYLQNVEDIFCSECYQLFKRERRRHEALWELFQSELFYFTNHLMVIKNVFLEPLKSIQVEGYAMFAEPEVLFGNLDELCLVTYAFCKEFLNILINQQSTNDGVHVTSVLVKLYLKNNRAASSTQAYHRYTLNYINALQYLETLRRHLEFIEFEKWCNRDPRCKKLQLTDLLVAPVQHLMRIPLLLKEIKNKTYDPEEKQIIASIIEQQENSLRELDDKMRWLKNFERLLEIQRNIIWPTVLDMDPKVFVPEFLKSFLAKQPCERLIVSPRRQIVLEGPLMVMDNGKSVEMYVFLFDDLLLITRHKKSLGKKQSTLTERWVSNCSGRTSSLSSVVGSSAAGTSAVGTCNAAVAAAASAIPGPGSVSTAPTSSSIPGSGTNTVVSNAMASSISMAGEPNHGPRPGGGATSGCFKYIVYKQPLSLDRFYIHDVSPSDAGSLKNAFVLVCLNRFQQIIIVHTFQAASESAKNTWLSKLRSTCDRWKRMLQCNVFRGPTVTSQSKSSRNDTKNNFNTKEQSSKTNEKIVDDNETEKHKSIDSVSTNVEASITYNFSNSQTTSMFT